MIKMSEDFLKAILKSKSSSFDEKIKQLSMVLDKIMEVSIRSITSIEERVASFESMVVGINNQTIPNLQQYHCVP